ncbi:hypothetical protein [Beijerinckia sp. L45]|uniref:hypothetical protein n=1 Tax=Beijerinckia sp. L45 TaxID=1641855 RepID=UPI00131B9CEA|nr:hypothetical protein [Beijerinckia sp. L45]
MTVLKRKGRPPKSDNGTVVVGAMRIDAEVYEALRLEAEENGRSVTAQAERRLKQREPNGTDIGRVIDMAIDAIQHRAEGKTWADDAGVRLQCRAAIDQLADLMLGELPQGAAAAFDQDQIDGAMTGDETLRSVKGTTFEFD